MKKIAILLVLCMIASLAAGCAGTPVVYYPECTCPTEVVEAAPEAPAASEAPAAEGALKTGLALVANVGDSKSATAEEAGEGKYDVTMVAVLVDDNGVIQDCIIDGIATSVQFDNKGALVTDTAVAPQTKNELGENYGMVAWGGAIAEWDAQAAALASFAVGKTVEELKSGAIDETGKAPAGSDLATQATIYLGGYVSAIEKAVANAAHLGAQAGDALKLAAVNEINGSKAAAADAAGLAQLYTTATALTLKGETITSCAIDAVQAKVEFDASGVVTTDLTAPVLTKNELGENYGMVAYGNAIAEWNVQAASFASYITGKTAADVAAIAVDEKTAPTDADLTASVTIKIGGFQDLIAKAAGAETQEGALKTGLALVANAGDSKSATAEEAGEGKYDVTMVAVLVDNNGVIQDCIIDGIATSVQFDNKGALVTDVAVAPQTKNELGENYGMVAWGGAIAEWDEQAAALASFAVGKTVEELKSGAIDETGKAPAGSDLATQATIYLGGYVSAIEKAVANAAHLGAQAGDALKLAAVNEISGSTSATAEAEGLAQLYTTVTALTLKGETITSCAIDAVQAKVNFDATGAVTTDLTAPIQTKNELGENYGMVAYGNAIAEWNVQAASFASYITGKTAADVASIAVDEKTAPTDADLTASVTIKIGGFQDLIAKAAQ
ncbi:MAG: hypothetical protein U0N82_00210 [Oscillospiraceae bacterium]